MPGVVFNVFGHLLGQVPREHMPFEYDIMYGTSWWAKVTFPKDHASTIWLSQSALAARTSLYMRNVFMYDTLHLLCQN